MTTALDKSHQLDRAGLAIVAQDMDLSGNLTVSGTSTKKSNVVSGSGATVTLTAAQSGSIVLFDRAGGIVFTLPAPAVGLEYTFVVKTTITAAAAKVITSAGTVFLVGNLLFLRLR